MCSAARLVTARFALALPLPGYGGASDRQLRSAGRVDAGFDPSSLELRSRVVAGCTLRVPCEDDRILEVARLDSRRATRRRCGGINRGDAA